MTFTVQSSCTRAGIVCASYTDSRAGECRNRVFLKNSNRCCGVSVLTARVVKVYMRTARVYIYRLAYSCVSVCADARGGGIGSTRGSPSESGTFHCRTRGGRIAIVLSLSIQLPLIRRWKTFSSFPGRGKFRCCSGLGSSSRAEPRSLSRDDALIRSSNASYSRITGNGVNPPRPMTQFTESRLY